MEQKLISKTALSKLAGVRTSTITDAVRGNLNAALVGNKIDVNHPVVLQYLATRKARGAAVKEKALENKTLQQMSSKVERFLDLTLREILEIFGTDYQFVEWLRASKSMEDIKEKRIKNEVSLGNLITRDYVKEHVFSIIETANVRLLNDSPRTITARVLEAHESGMRREQIEKLVCELIGAQIKGLKLRARRKLNA